MSEETPATELFLCLGVWRFRFASKEGNHGTVPPKSHQKSTRFLGASGSQSGFFADFHAEKSWSKCKQAFEVPKCHDGPSHSLCLRTWALQLELYGGLCAQESGLRVGKKSAESLRTKSCAVKLCEKISALNIGRENSVSLADESRKSHQRSSGELVPQVGEGLRGNRNRSTRLERS